MANKSIRLSFTLWTIGLVSVVAGCSRKYYRVQADRDVAAIYAETRCEEAYTLPPLPGIEVDPRSRFYDPSPEDCPSLGLPEPQLFGYELPELVTGDPHQQPTRSDEELPNPTEMETLPVPEASEPDSGTADDGAADDQGYDRHDLVYPLAPAKPVTGEVRLAQLITAEAQQGVDLLPDEEPEWDSTSDERAVGDELRIVPIPAEFWSQLPATCLPRMLEFESVRKEFRRSFPDATAAEMSQMTSDAPRLTLPMITELASLNNRAIQTQKERLYRAALVLTAQRYQYVLRPRRFGNGTDVNYTHIRYDGTTRNGLSIPTGTAVRKTTAMAGQFLASFANQVVLTFNGPSGFTADIGSDLVFEFQQTLFQRDVVFESLTSAERQVVYVARDLIRAQRALFVDLASNYYQLLLSNRAIEISSQDYFSNLRAFLQGRAEYLQAGRIPRVQVDQFEQNALGSRSSLVGDCNSLESALDRLKLLIGLPPEMPLNLNLEELDALTTSDELTVTRQLVMRTRQTLLDAAQTQVDDRDAAVNGATVLINRLRDSLRVRRRIEGIQQETDAERDTEQLGRLLAVLEARLRGDQLDAIRKLEMGSDLPPPALKQFARTVDLVEARLTLADRAAVLHSDVGDGTDVADWLDVDRLGRQLGELRKRWDAAIEQRELGRLSDLVEQAEDLLGEANKLADKLVGDLLPDNDQELDDFIMQVVADAVDLVDRVETSDVGGLDDVEVQENDAMLLALYQRLDLMNRRGELADDRRRIKLAADDLRAILDIGAVHQLSANRFISNPNSPFDFREDGSTTRLSLALDTPMNRRLERNLYRAALIDYQAGRRALIESEDQIKFSIREDLRQLRLRRNQYEISVARAALAYERVVSTRLQLQLAVGNVVARDFLEAQQAYTSALTSVARDHISFIRGRIDLFFDTESIRLDANGYWSGGQDDALDLPPLPDFYDVNPNPYGRLPHGLHYSDEVRQNH